MEITRYIVTDNPDDADGYEYDSAEEARAIAYQQKAVVIERTYVYDDETIAFDYREQPDANEE